MQPTEKYRADLDQAAKRSAGQPESRRLEALREHFLRSHRGLPEEILSEFFVSFSGRWKEDPEAALAWLASIGSILLMDYDGYALSRRDWEEVRETINLDAGGLDLAVLEYALSLVVDHGAL